MHTTELTPPCSARAESGETLRQDAPVPPPRVAKSSDELAEACTTLQGQLEELTESIEKRLTQLKVQRERNLVRDREYHELALENKDLAIAISRVGLFNVSHFRVLNVLS